MTSTGPLAGKIALVTGASRGIGRGIALQLTGAGATVYITGRAPDASYREDKNKGVLPSLEQTAKEANARGGGQCLPIYCDHSNLDDIQKLFKQIEKEQGGKLDVLVNNAYSAVPALIANGGKKFWESDLEMWDTVNEVGLRNVFFCSALAARLMVPRGTGLIVNLSSLGGEKYLFGVAYGVGKAGVDKMAKDMAVELKEHGVTVISLWPGFAQTELLSGLGNPAFDSGESVEFPGKAIIALTTDPKVIEKTGKIHTTTELALAYGYKDIDGRLPPDARGTK